MSWQRARSEEQKDQRVQEILEAGCREFLTKPYHSITLLGIAQVAKISRTNIYRYFATKEEIFLAILQDDLELWVKSMEESPGKEISINDFAQWWSQTFAQRDRLPELLPLLSQSLEENIQEERLREFKLALADFTGRMGAVLRARLPWFPPQRIGEFALTQLALVSGFTPMTQRGGVHNKILEDPRLQGFAIDFVPSYAGALETWLEGVYSQLDQSQFERNEKKDTL
jgi:AcrR family transcriptional regulator